MIIVTSDIIENLNPCINRYENFLEHYKDFEGSIIEFINLDKISYDDKIWVCIQLIPIEFLKDWAILCAESVLSYYEQSTNDLTIREQLVLLKTHRTLSYTQLQDIRDRIYSKRTDADAAAAYAAYAAAYAADAAYDAVYAADAAADAAYAAYAAAAYAAADAAYTARQKQQQINLDLLREVLENKND